MELARHPTPVSDSGRYYTGTTLMLDAGINMS